MKKLRVIGLILAMTILLTACGHEHVWQAANCVSPKICPECGETEGEALGHNWEEATCTDKKVCVICGLTIGDALGHSWEEATCELAKTCSVCAQMEGTALGHKWSPATCVLPEICEVCAAENGAALGHSVENWTTTEDSTCTSTGIETGTCSVCGQQIEQVVAMKEHTPGEWEVTVQPTPDEDGEHIKNCTVCGTELEREEFTLSDEEIEKLYKSNCQSISYNSLARTPGDYEGAYVKFSGKVVQVCYEAESILYYSTYRLATSGGYDNVVYIKVDNYGSGSRILEDDWITIYGEFEGLFTYETVMGATMTIPCVKVEYVD